MDQTTGAVAVAWYDARNDVPGGPGNTNGITNDEAQLYAAASVNGGASFLPNVLVSAGTSRSAGAEPPAQGVRPLGFGDYEDVDFYGGAFYPVWADNSNSTGDNPDAPHMDIYTSRVVVRGETVTATGGAGDDTYYLRLDPSGTYLQVYENNPTLSGAPTFTALLSAVSSIAINGGAGDDHVIIDFANGSPLPSGALTYDGGSTRLNGNTLVLQGGSDFNSETYTPSGPTSGSIDLRSGFVLVNTPPSITYANVQAITDTVNLVAFPLSPFGQIPPRLAFYATALPDAVSITNGALVNNQTTLQISSGGTFTPVTFANKANVSVSGLAGRDTITLNYGQAAAGLGTLLIDGGTEGDIVNVQVIAANVPVTVNGGAGDDTVYIGLNTGPNTGNLDRVRSPVTVDGQDGTNDTVILFDNGVNFGDSYTIDDRTVRRPFFGGLTYAGIEYLMLRAEGGNNTITVTNLAPATAVTIDGGGGSDTLIGPNFFNTWSLTSANQGMLSALLTVNPNTVGRVSFTNVENLTGGPNTDAFQFNPGASVSGRIDGGGGTNALDYSLFTGLGFGGPGVNVTLADWPAVGTATAVTGGVTHIRTVEGSRGNDHIVGNSEDNVIISYGGVDVLAGGNGNDSFFIYGQQFMGTSIDGGPGNDTLKGPDGVNTWNLTGLNSGDVSDAFGDSAYANIENLLGGLNSDTFRFPNLTGGISGVLNGNLGTDWLDYSQYPGTVTVNLETGSATGAAGGAVNHVYYMENVLGSRTAGNTLTGASSAATGNARGNILVGGNLADVLTGGSGRNLLIGGRGADQITGGGADDILIGGTTDWDSNTTALTSLLREWSRTDAAATYQHRIDDLRTGTADPARLNGGYFLNAQTVHDDGQADVLRGSGGTDWFWASLAEIFDHVNGEMVN